MRHPQQVDQQEEDKQERKRRSKSLPGAILKLAKDANALVQTAQLEEARNIKEHERVRAIANTATGGSFTAILKKSPVLTDDDREFLKDLKYI